MSWAASLIDDRGHCEGEWNYTHNCNNMIAAAYEAHTGVGTEQTSGVLGAAIGACWWDRLDGATGQDGRRYLADIISGLEADPARYRAMNPENGWGSYDTLLERLQEMRDRVPDWPCTWRVSG
jgi:hypothetical protein